MAIKTIQNLALIKKGLRLSEQAGDSRGAILIQNLALIKKGLRPSKAWGLTI